MKPPKFAVGDICVAYNDPEFTAKEETHRYTGEECEVIAVLIDHFTLDELIKLCYKVQFGDGTTLLAKEHELRRKEDDDWVKQKVADLCFPMPIEFMELTEA